MAKMTNEQIQNFLEQNGIKYLSAWKIDTKIFDHFDHETIKQVIKHNTSFIYEHGLELSDVEKYTDIQKQFKARTTSTKEVSPCDILQVWSNNGHIFYENAHIEKCSYNDTGWTWVEHASSHFISLNSFSSSGGAWHELNINGLEHIGQELKTIWTWGHCGATGNGGLYIPVLVNKFKMVLDRKWIAMTACRIYNSDYKYEVRLWDKKPTCYRSGDEAFKTMAELKTYLKNRGLKIGKKMKNAYFHEIIGDFDYIMHMDMKGYETERGNLKEFPLLDNGDYTGAFFKAGNVHFCNPNVKNRPRLSRPIY